jgi:DNA-binding NarL/FixJ family response regulator
VSRGAERRVAICLDDPALDASLAAALVAAGFHAESGFGAQLSLDGASDAFGVVVVDGGVPDWLRIAMDLVRRQPDIRPVVVAEIDNPDEFLAALTGGVCGFCRSDAGVDAIVRTIESVYSSGVSIPRDMVGPLVAQVRHGRGHRMNTIAGPIDVTDREWEIMQLMLQRRTTREIANALYVSTGTVRSHVSALMHKAGAVDRDDLVAMVERYQRR